MLITIRHISDAQSHRQWRGSKWFVLSTCCIATFSDIYTYGVLPPILPFVLPDRAGVAPQDVQTWVAVLPAIIGVSIAISAPLAGWLSDHCTHRQPLFLAALGVQAIAMGLFMAGVTISLWIVGAVLSGVSSGMVWASCLSIIVDRVDRVHVAQFLGYTSLSLSLGIFLGPVAGGVIYEYGGSYAVWGTCFGLIFLDAIMRIMLVEPRKEETSSLNSSRVVGGGLGPQRVAAIHLLKSPRLLCTLWATMVMALILTSFDASLTIHVQRTFGWSSTAAGLLWIAFAIPSFLSPVVGRTADYFGGRLIAVCGFTIGIVVLVCFRFVDHNSISQKVLLCTLLFLMGLLLGATIPIFSAQVSRVVFEYEKAEPGIFGENGGIAQAEGLWWAAYAVGTACGPLWGGFVQDVAGWDTMAWTLAVLCGSAVVPAFLGTDGFLRPRKQDQQPVPCI